MRLKRIICIAVILLSVVAIVWSLGGGMSRPRSFDFTIEGAMEAGEVPDTTGWSVLEIRLDTAGGRYTIEGRAARPCVVEVGTEEVAYCSTLFIERGRITVEQGCATGTAANDARTAMRAEVDSLAWICPEGEYSEAYERGYDSIARAYIEQNRANIYGGWLAERLSRGESIEQARELYEVLSSGVRRTEAVAPLRERVERYDRSQEGRRVALPEAVVAALEDGECVVLDFWASWNVDQQARARQLDAATRSYADDGVAVCRISMDNSREQWQQACQEEPSEWLQLFGAEVDIEPLSIESLPMSYVISGQGRVVVRSSSVDDVAEALAELFSQKN